MIFRIRNALVSGCILLSSATATENMELWNAVAPQHSSKAASSDTSDRNLFYVNPCTGEISNDSHDDDGIMPCVARNQTLNPTIMQTVSPSETQSASPSSFPTQVPSRSPTQQPSSVPTGVKSQVPTDIPPTSSLSTSPSAKPTGVPSQSPSSTPTTVPSTFTTIQASNNPSELPTVQSSVRPTTSPTGHPSAIPTLQPSVRPSTSPTGQPSSSPVIAPTALPSSVPTQLPSSKPSAPPVDELFCPGKTSDFNSDKDTVVVVNFVYSVDTTSNAKDATVYIPDIEENLVERVGKILLSHCNDNGGSARRELQRRTLQRRLAVIGISSNPKDEVSTSGECVPKIDASNNCFVVNGALSVAIEAEDSPAAVTSSVRSIVQSVMTSDNLLSSEYDAVKRIEYVQSTSGVDSEIQLGLGGLEQDTNPEADGISVKGIILIGTSFAAAVLLLGIGLATRNGNRLVDEEGAEDKFGLTIFPGILQSSGNKTAVKADDKGDSRGGIRGNMLCSIYEGNEFVDDDDDYECTVQQSGSEDSEATSELLGIGIA